MNNTPLRSVLYMPGSNQRAMDKARSLPADAIVFDLEDAVAPDAKASARDAVVAQLAAGGYGARLLAVRSNAVTGPWGEADIAAIAASRAQVLVLPKVEQGSDLTQVRTLLDLAGRPDMPLWAMIETPAGMENAAHIAACAGVAALVMGTTDLAAELRLPQGVDRLGLQYALGRCVMAARRAGIPVLDGVHLDLDDDAGFHATCIQGRALGFDGRTLIHPRQIDTANAVYGPSAAQLEHARRLLKAWEEALARGSGLAVLDGRLVESMHVEEARRLLAMSERIAALGGA